MSTSYRKNDERRFSRRKKRKKKIETRPFTPLKKKFNFIMLYVVKKNPFHYILNKKKNANGNKMKTNLFSESGLVGYGVQINLRSVDEHYELAEGGAGARDVPRLVPRHASQELREVQRVRKCHAKGRKSVVITTDNVTCNGTIL